MFTLHKHFNNVGQDTESVLQPVNSVKLNLNEPTKIQPVVPTQS